MNGIKSLKWIAFAFMMGFSTLVNALDINLGVQVGGCDAAGLILMCNEGDGLTD